MTEHVDRLFAFLIPILCPFNQRFHVIRPPGQSKQTTFLVKKCVYVFGGVPFLLHQVKRNGRIQVTTSRAHDKSFERCKPHGCVQYVVSVECSNTAPVAQVA